MFRKLSGIKNFMHTREGVGGIAIFARIFLSMKSSGCF